MKLNVECNKEAKSLIRKAIINNAKIMITFTVRSSLVFSIPDETLLCSVDKINSILYKYKAWPYLSKKLKVELVDKIA